MSFNGKMFESGHTLPADFKPEQAHISGGDVIYSSSSPVKEKETPTLTATEPEKVIEVDEKPIVEVEEKKTRKKKE